MSWDTIPLDSPLGTIGPVNIAIIGADPTGHRAVILAKVHAPSAARVRVDYQDTTVRDTLPPLWGHGRVPSSTTVSEFAVAFAQIRATHAGTVPRVVGLRTKIPAWLLIAIIAIGMVLIMLGLVFPTTGLGAPGAIFALASIVLHRLQDRGSAFSASPRVIEHGRDVLPSRIVERLGAPAAAGPTPLDRVNLAKEEYAALHSDIVYRIENSALFDVAVPETQRFQLALMAWDAASPDAGVLADEVEHAFAAAKARAEQLGLGHLPVTARDPARRAARAAATALASEHEGERLAAATRAADILASLALYYLPTVDPATPALIGIRKQIEPR